MRFCSLVTGGNAFISVTYLLRRLQIFEDRLLGGREEQQATAPAQWKQH